MPFPDFLPYLIQFNAAPCTAFACHPQDVYTLLYICHLASYLHEGALPLVRHGTNQTCQSFNLCLVSCYTTCVQTDECLQIGLELSQFCSERGREIFISTCNLRCNLSLQRIIDRYPLPHSPYLLPIIFPGDVDPRRQYLYRIRSINHHLRNLSFQAGISSTLTTYVARHSWASIARAKDFPLSVISEGLGHENEATTRIYLQSIESTQVDIANKEILGEL